MTILPMQRECYMADYHRPLNPMLSGPPGPTAACPSGTGHDRFGQEACGPFASIDMTAPERILIVDDHALVRDGLRSLLATGFPDCEIREADCFEAACASLATQGDVDLVLLDLNIPDVSRFSGLATLRKLYPAIPVVMLSSVADDATIRQALAAGAAGFLPKSLNRNAMVHGLTRIIEGEIYIPELVATEPEDLRVESEIRIRIAALTPQQKVVLGHLVAGRLNKQIAYELDVSITTVKAHVSAIMRKLNVFSRTQAVIMASQVNFSTQTALP